MQFTGISESVLNVIALVLNRYSLSYTECLNLPNFLNTNLEKNSNKMYRKIIMKQTFRRGFNAPYSTKIIDLNCQPYKHFDTTNIDNTLPPELEKWLRDMGYFS